ncbi:MAG TPA: GNAT family N-acetyltransferase [Candidatus Dormibacteraeota bacterium]|jgi:ribosomal protein S18 acetylase RimI-like enzyme|nr:GNAT family N-acetyltransferase [Candidatus Dormibacteraeota bacterium]
MAEFARYRPRRRASGAGSIDVRVAETGDAGAIAAIHAGREGVEIEVSRRRVDGWLASPGSVVLVGEVSGTVAAYGRAARLEGEGCPEGWYLAGLVVSPRFRRHGIGRALTIARLELVAERADEAFYFANERNRATIDLHSALGFSELTREFTVPGVSFEGGAGILFRIDLDRRA